MFCHAFRCAWRGVCQAARTGRNFRIMIVAFAAVTAAGIVFHVSATEWLAILLCSGGAFALELMNTAIEQAVDLATRQWHPLAKAAKDIAAGAVLVWSIFCAAIGLLIFVPCLIAAFG